MKLPNGVWIGKDIEIFRAGTIEVVYQRVKNPDGIQASLHELIYESDESDAVIRRTIGIVTHIDGSDKIAYACGSKLTEPCAIISNDEVLSCRLNENVIKVKAEADGSITADSGICREKYADQSAWIYDRSTDVHHSLIKFDDIGMRPESFYPIDLSSASVGKCLAQWIKGIRVFNNYNGFVLEMYTDRASCCFIVNDSYVYCGAGRYGICDAGMFSSKQGFRIFKSGDRLDAYMLRDLNLTMQDLVIDESNFTCLKCSSAPISTNAEWTPSAGIYFSVKEAKESTIILTGCSDDYVYSKDDPSRISYFE